MMDVADDERGSTPPKHPTSMRYSERETGKALYRVGSLITTTVGRFGRNA